MRRLSLQCLTWAPGRVELSHSQVRSSGAVRQGILKFVWNGWPLRCWVEMRGWELVPRMSVVSSGEEPLSLLTVCRWGNRARCCPRVIYPATYSQKEMEIGIWILSVLLPSGWRYLTLCLFFNRFSWYVIAIGQILRGEGLSLLDFSVSEYLRNSITLKQHN